MIKLMPQEELAPGNVKVTRWDWINLALEVLIADGVESVRILPLGERLGVSRSSFYHYFESRQDLLDRLLEHWRDTNTKAIVERAARPADSIVRAVANVFECWADESLFDPRFDFAVREWARRSADVRDVIDAADDERLGAIRDMYLRHGYDEEDAFIRARVLYYMQIGYYTLDVKEQLETRLGHLAAYLRSFTGQEPSEADVAHFSAFAIRTQNTKPIIRRK
ncbi:TetR/AcrR family transcriptional regulator [Pseudaminobacter soli (ex Li et al. 2025)]|uniref:TetR/AcrR family transcriptional regulator n=1 Tax=Pseudaminobacter soli (ex Li et al. 2025) TaxID=1295366 RepID=UPI003CCFFC82